MNEKERALRQAFIRHLVVNIECANCGQGYARNDIYVLGHHEGVWVSAVVCSRCGTQGLVFATLQDEGQFDVISDLTPDEAEAFSSLPALSVDDVLDVHAFLREFDGDVEALFSKGTRRD